MRTGKRMDFNFLMVRDRKFHKYHIFVCSYRDAIPTPSENYMICPGVAGIPPLQRPQISDLDC